MHQSPMFINSGICTASVDVSVMIPGKVSRLNPIVFLIPLQQTEACLLINPNSLFSDHAFDISYH